MPTYGYTCEKCEKHFEVFQKITDKPLKKCPACSGKVNRVFYPVGIIFKGSGFYTTDYARPKPKKEVEHKKEKKNEKKEPTKEKKAPSSDKR